MPQLSNIESAFVAYRHSGEDPEVLRPMLQAVVDVLGRAGVNSYCTFFEEEKFQAEGRTRREIMDHAFEMIRERDMLFVVKHSTEISEGMMMEVGMAREAGIPVVVAVQEEVKNEGYLPEMGDFAFSWTDEDDLASKIRTLPFA